MQMLNISFNLSQNILRIVYFVKHVKVYFGCGKLNVFCHDISASRFNF